MNKNQLTHYINQTWDNHILPALKDYITIPNKSPHFDPHWQANGHMQRAVDLISTWCQTQSIPNMTVEVIQLEGRTPVIFMEIPGQNEDTVLLYGHLDKQPEMTGWDDDLDPWRPVLKGNRLYGRGSADDGYAAFASLTAIKALHDQGIPHARCIILIEACEESGSFDLPYYIDALSTRIGEPSLIVCLDSGCGNYEQLWVTTSLRGLLGGTLTINVLNQGVHSGFGSGVVPACSRLLRILLDRVEDQNNGTILLDELQVNIPSDRIQQAKETAAILGDELVQAIPFLPGVQPDTLSPLDLLLRRTWKPALSVIGCDGIPSIKNAGNVTLPTLSVRLSMRLPPTCSPSKAAEAIKKTLEQNPPNHAEVHFEVNDTGPGWNAPSEHAWLTQAIKQASLNHFGKPAAYIGEGGSIPFMGMLGEKYPKAQFLITGLLGPGSNAHGPNEFLDIPTGKKLTACVAEVIADHYHRP